MQINTFIRILCLMPVIAASLAIADNAVAGEKKLSALVSPPLSFNFSTGLQPLCLVTNASDTTTISVTVEIVFADGYTSESQLIIPPGGIDAASDVDNNFYSYCRITPQDPADLPLLRGSHCMASSNTVVTCVEAR